ncbi:MAG: PIN domain-containing protein [Acidobacteriota bacterium]|jgi:predicted nucleic acid-binding protein|nr:PIN domain-containing protein [Acidobacteriota bacterium]MDQ3372752.1 PIN domain-containing protein [Acidobacteriota bacterium]
MNYLLDSGFLYGFIDEADQHHEVVSEALGKIHKPIILPVPAITEVAYFVSKNLSIEALANFLDEISETDFILEMPTAEDYKRSAEILRKYNDANIDFVDAVIVAIAERLNITKVLTVDRRHFGAFKPRHCAAFEILP